MKPKNCGTRKKIFSYFTVGGTVRIRLQEKSPYSIITNIDDLKELFPDEDFSIFLIRLYGFVRVQIVNIYLDNCIHIWVIFKVCMNVLIMN